MLVREEIQDRLSSRADGSTKDVEIRLPLRLKLESDPVRTAMLKRLSSSRQFAFGNRAGVLRAAHIRSGRAFRLDIHQRVIVKASVSRHTGRGPTRAGALAAHVSYLGRLGAGEHGIRPEFFDQHCEGVDALSAIGDWRTDRHHFRFILSPEHGDRIHDLRDYVQETMRRVSADLGEPALPWIATCHFDTDQPHAHVLVRGRRADSRDLVIPRDYMGYGFRARAQEVAQERLGDLSRIDAERRVWRETVADRFTGFDRRLLAAADIGGMVNDGAGEAGAWTALTRGRLRHLEGLGLAVREGRKFRLDGELELKLRTLQHRRDEIRTLNQRHLETGSKVELLNRSVVRGRVIKVGFHDEAGTAAYVIVRNNAGVEFYARLKAGFSEPEVGKEIGLAPIGPSLAQVIPTRGADLAR